MPLTSLNEIDDNLQYSFSKKTDMPYTLGTPTSNSPFEMQYFRGIIECDNLDNLNLQLVAGNQSFDENSLNNHEIIISDYAAFELRRTGYLGLDNQGNYGVIHPNSLEDQINSSVRIYSTNYKIIGVFKTNYEDFLPLIVSETYVDDDNQKASSLDALKNYYYARVFGPSGFYNKYVLDNANDFAPTTFSMSVSRVPLYEFDSAGDRLDETLTYKDLYIGNISSFLSYENYRTKLIGRQTLVWGQIPSSLKNNQIILTTNWIGYNGGFNSREAINEAIPTLQENLYINKMLDSNTVDYTLYGGGFEIVAVISISNNATDSDRLSEVGAFFSDDFSYRLNNSIYDFDQMVTTTYNNTSKNSRLFNKFYKNGYHILNIDGKVPTDTLDIQSFQTFGLIAGVVVFVFAILFMFNYVSTSIKKRRKEIGILRATGARSNDILKMFLVEEGILAIVATLVSLLLIVYIRGIVNEQLGNVAIGINIINISFIFVLLYVVATLIFFVITTLIPVMSIAKMKPIDAIRKI